VFGAEALNFTAVVSSIDDSEAPFPGFAPQFTRFTSANVQILTHKTLLAAPGRSLVVGERVATAVLPAGEDGAGVVSSERFREEDGEAARSIRFTQISEGVTVRGKVRVGLAFFR
jgi:hypothetical protein